MIPPRQFLNHIIRPVLATLAGAEPRIHTIAAEKLMLGTALKESGLSALLQAGGGPARSMFQIEPETCRWVWYDFVRVKNRRFLQPVGLYLFGGADADPLAQLAGNQHFAAGIARLRYWAVAAPLPAADDVAGLARYWGSYYQTESIPEQVAEWERLYHTHAAECFR